MVCRHFLEYIALKRWQRCPEFLCKRLNVFQMICWSFSFYVPLLIWIFNQEIQKIIINVFNWLPIKTISFPFVIHVIPSIKISYKHLSIFSEKKIMPKNNWNLPQTHTSTQSNNNEGWIKDTRKHLFVRC